MKKVNNPLKESNCKKRNCSHFIGEVEDKEKGQKLLCRAFLFGIPDEIAFGNNKHLVPLEGQENCLVYEKKETNETIFEGGFGISFDLKDPVAVDFIVNKTISIRDAYGLQYKGKDLPIILRKIKNQLIDGYMYPRTLRMVAERIVDDLLGMVDINIKQASLISSTEILGAKGYSDYTRINNSGFKQKKWFTARDEKVRPLHQEMHGKKINVGDLWVFSDGNTLRYPGDDQGPDHLVVGCRCIEVVVPESHILQK